MPVAQQQLGQPMPGPHQVAAAVLPGPDQVPGGLLLHARAPRTAMTSSRRSSRARCIASRASVLTRSPAGRCSFDGAATSHRIPAAVSARHSPNPVGPGLVGHRHRTRQRPPPSRMIASWRGVSLRLEHLTGHPIDRRRRDRPCVHVQPNTRTLCKHRGLPQLSDRPSRQPLLGNPRIL